MKENNYKSQQNIDKDTIPIHSLENDSKQINILPLDHTNPYDYKREHRHTYFEIMVIERGGCNQLIDFKNYVGEDYSCYIICPQQIHLMNRNNSSGTVVQFTEDRINSAKLRATLREISLFESAAIIFENQSEIVNELQSLLNVLQIYTYKNNSNNNQVVTHLLQAFISVVLENSQTNKIAVKDADKKLLIEFYQSLELNYKKQIGVQFFIEELGTTEKKLAATIKKHTGLRPLQIIHNRILLEAKRLLVFEENYQKEIAYQLGFDSPASFSAFIKTKTGFAPSQLIKHLEEIHK